LDFLDLDNNLAEEDEISIDDDLKGPPSLLILLKANQAKSTFSHNSKHCWGDSTKPNGQTWHVCGMPSFCSHVPMGRPLFKVSHMRVPTLCGLEKCHNLVKIYYFKVGGGGFSSLAMNLKA
jgi:hypothetical protein